MQGVFFVFARLMSGCRHHKCKSNNKTCWCTVLNFNNNTTSQPKKYLLIVTMYALVLHKSFC